MSRWRVGIASMVVIALAGIAAWQWSRERQIASCQSSGGIWNGAGSQCTLPRPVIIERGGLQRG